jgi:hypothetical protein
MKVCVGCTSPISNLLGFGVGVHSTISHQKPDRVDAAGHGSTVQRLSALRVKCSQTATQPQGLLQRQNVPTGSSQVHKRRARCGARGCAQQNSASPSTNVVSQMHS